MLKRVQSLQNNIQFLWGALAVLVMLGLMACAAYLTQPFKKVWVVGPYQSLTPRCIATAMQQHFHGNFISFRAQPFAQAVQEDCPWLGGMRVHRSWPPKLTLLLQERQAHVMWNQRALVSDDGALFAPSVLPKATTFTQLQGPTDQFQAVYAFFKQATVLLQAQGLGIAQIVLDDSGTYTITLNNQVTLVLNQGNALQTLQRFVSVDHALFSSSARKLSSIDLRYPHGFAVKWRNG
jgi:cell division protein FtsQ